MPGRAGALQVLLDRQGGRQRAHPQQVVAAAVAVASRLQGTGFGHARLLAQPAQGVELPQQADDRTAAAVPGGERRGDIGHPPGDRKALFLQIVRQQPGRDELGEGRFGVVPHTVGQVAQLPAFRSMIFRSWYSSMAVHTSWPK